MFRSAPSPSFRLHLLPRLETKDSGDPIDPVDPARSVREIEEERDLALVSAVRAGMPDAAAALFDAHASRIERVLYRILGPLVDLADPLNATFCRALDHLGELHEPRGLVHWLSAIAVNVAREQLRSTRRRSWLEYRATDALPEAPRPPNLDASDEAVAAKFAVEQLFLVLAQMPEEERLAFSLRRLEELSNEEVALALQVSLATAKRRMARANERFALLARRMPELRAWVDQTTRPLTALEPTLLEVVQ